MSRSGTSPARRYRGLGGLLLAQGMSLTGTRVSAIALPWLVLTSTGSTALTGLAAFAEMAPYVLVKAAAGPLIDRIGPRRVSLVGDLVSAAAVLALPVAHAAGALPVWLLLTLVAVVGCVRGPGDAAKVAMTPDAADSARIPLERVTGLTGATERLATTVGPAVGAAAVASLGAATALVANAIAFLVSALVIALAAPARRPVPVGATADASAADEGGYWERLRSGVSFLRRDRLLSTALVMTAVTNLLDAAWVAVLVPVWVRQHELGAGAVGAVFSVMSAASVGASLLAAWLGDRLPRRATFLIGFTVAGIPRFLVLAAGAPLWAVLAVNAVSGFAGGFLNPILGAVLYERIPRELTGRVVSVGDALSMAGVPLGGLFAGAALGLVSFGPVVLVAGAVYFATTTLVGLRPEWRGMDRPRRPVAAAHSSA